jgi:hypothetical protein
MGLFAFKIQPWRTAMRGTAAKQAGEGNYQYDAEGNLVVPSAETEEERMAVEAVVLYKEGMSVNHPDDVAAQYAEPEPPDPEVEEGETQEQYDSRREQRRAEWQQRNEERRAEREQALEKQKQEREARLAERRGESQGEQGEQAPEEGQGYQEETPAEEAQGQEDDSRRGRRNRNR